MRRERWIGPAPWIPTPPPGPRALRAVARDRRVTSPSHARPYPLVVRRAQGSIVEDVDGSRYLDLTGGLTVGLGHGHPLVVRAVGRQARRLIQCCGNNFYHEPMIALAEKLTRLAPGEHAKRVLFTPTGPAAAAAAAELAREYTRRKRIITLDVDIASSDLPKPLAAPETVAAIFVEPLGMDGRNALPPAGYLPSLRKLCDDHGIVLVVDETRTGMGRTGRMFCCEHEAVVPDLLLLGSGLASGMPLGAVIAREPVADRAKTARASNPGGNPLSYAAALATIEVLEKQMIANAAALHPIALGKLQETANRHKCIAPPCGLGLLLRVEVVSGGRSHRPDPALRDRIISEAFSRGLLLIGCGRSGIHITPPLCINRVQLEVGLDVFDEVVATVST